MPIPRKNLEDALSEIKVKSQLPATLEEAKEKVGMWEDKIEELERDKEDAQSVKEESDIAYELEHAHDELKKADRNVTRVRKYGEPDYEALKLERRRIKNYLSDTYETEEVPA